MGIGRWKGSVAGSGLYPGVLCSCKLKIGTQRALFCREMTRYWCMGSSKSTGYGRKSYMRAFQRVFGIGTALRRFEVLQRAAFLVKNQKHLRLSDFIGCWDRLEV